MVTIQQTAATIAHSSSFGGSYNERKFKIRKSTTLSRSHKQVTVFTSPPFKWLKDVVYNQINGRLGNAKRLIWVTSVESSRGSLSLATSNIPDKDDLEGFTILFKSELEQKAPETNLQVEIPTSKSCLKICDFPYYRLSPKCDEKTGKLVPLTVDQIAKILDSSPFVKDFRYYENSLPCLSKNAGNSDTCTIWIGIADSCTDLNLQNLVSRSFTVTSKSGPMFCIL